LDPDDKRTIDSAQRLVLSSKRVAARVAAKFVLITKLTIPFVCQQIASIPGTPLNIGVSAQKKAFTSLPPFETSAFSLFFLAFFCFGLVSGC
jgi:hypothetical protein